MSELIAVNADALRQVLNALNGPGHYIRELQVTRNLDELMETTKNPINLLVKEFNDWAQNPPPDVSGVAEALSPWLSAALEDQNVCAEFKTAVTNWFAAAKPALVMGNAEIMDAYQAMQAQLQWVKEMTADIAPDIYVSDVGQAWGAETNPDLANDPNMVAHVEVRNVKAMQAELKWVKDVIAEHLGYDGPLGPAVCPLAEVLAMTKDERVQAKIKELEQDVATETEVSNALQFDLAQMREKMTQLEMDKRMTEVNNSSLIRDLESKAKQIKFAREYAEKKSLEAATYLPKILQLTALLKRARVDVQSNFQMNADLERFHPLPADDQAEITKVADKYQLFLDEIDAALWVPPAQAEADWPTRVEEGRIMSEAESQAAIDTFNGQGPITNSVLPTIRGAVGEALAAQTDRLMGMPVHFDPNLPKDSFRLVQDGKVIGTVTNLGMKRNEGIPAP